MTEEPVRLIAVSPGELDDLRLRLTRIRWPPPWPVPEWQAGTSAEELQRLVRYWATDYDWGVQEAAINGLPSHFATIAGDPIHYLRFDGERDDAVPIVLTNGWPSTFLELTEVAARLATPSRFGGRGKICFTVIVPSLPGFTFSSQRPTLPSDEPTHELWHLLMHEHLGFERYVAHGGDLGAGITSRLAAAHPDELIGIHLLAVGNPSQTPSALTDDENDYLDRVRAWAAEEGGYLHEQSTRPLSLAYALTDSPVGLLGWMLEKYRAWSDNRSGPAISDDFLLTQASLYWFTNTISTSLRPYYEYGRGVSRALEPVSVPTALALFPADLAQPPRSWAQRSHNVVRYQQMSSGGHFAAIEQPQLLAADIADFVRSLL